MRIRGEYWIYPDSTFDHADGDTGDTNHTQYVLVAGIAQVLDIAACAADPALCAVFATLRDDYDGDVTWFRADMLDAVDQYQRAHPEATHLDDIRQCLLDAGVSTQLYAALWDPHTDAREWAREHLDWISVRGHNIALHTLTDKKVAAMRDALWEITDQEGITDVDALEFELVDEATGARYSVAWAQLVDGCATLLAPKTRRQAAALGYV